MSYLFSTPKTLKSDVVGDRAESRINIRRNRSVGSRSQSMSMSQEPATSFDASTSTGSRFRKKYSVPARPLDFNISGVDIGSANEDIERRRRRIRSISNSVPPLPVPSIYRGYLPRSTATKGDESGPTYSWMSAARKTALDSEKSSYPTAREKRNLLVASKDAKVSHDEQSAPIDNGENKSDNSSVAESKPTGTDRKVHVNGDTKFKISTGEEERSTSTPEPKKDNKSNASNELTKNVLNLTLNLSDRSDLDDSDMEGSTGNKPKRSASLKVPSSTASVPLERKKSSPIISATMPGNRSTESLPDLSEGGPRTPNNSATRLKRDFHLTDTEISALRAIIKKADLYDQEVRERMFHVIKIETDSENDTEEIAAKVVTDKENESLKQRLFMSRKELDSYISFAKKMEREKRQLISEKEELDTKIQWHERRLTRFENENKSIKQERANLMNQIYELRTKSSSMKDSGHARQKSIDANALSQQSKLESSKQRFIHEADVFAQERTKLIKERQRLDEENRRAHIRNVSLIAQAQHWEKTAKELEAEKDELKTKLSKLTRQSVDDQRKSINGSRLEKVDSLDDKNQDNYNCLIETIKLDDTEITRLRKELESLEEKNENLKSEFRNLEENQITIDHENMALRDTVNVLQNAKEESDVRHNEIDIKYRETMTEFKTVSIASEELEKENLRLQKELELSSAELAELLHEAVEMESDQDAFKKFLDKLSMELQEKLGEEHVSKDKEAESLQEQAEMIGRQIVAHLNPSRKLQEDYESMKEDKEDLEEEIQFLKFALANRMEIKNLQAPVQKCECSKEKAALKRDLEDALARLESREDEVVRLHQDKQQLLMSFLNLQAAQRSRDVSKSGVATDDDLSEDDETDSESEVGNKRNSSYMRNTNEVNELRQRLDEADRRIELLEAEREEMLDSLCRQENTNSNLKNELEDLKSEPDVVRPSSRTSSRTESSIRKTESMASMASIASERCPNCIDTGDEIRKYLSIIEELTEDKLRLEKSVNDLELDKSKCETDLVKLTESVYLMENEMSLVDNEKESTVRNAREETKMLLRNVQSLQEENQVLEENLRTMDEDRREVLENLKQAEEDRLGFIRTLQLIAEQKETVEEEMDILKKENEVLLDKLCAVTGNVCSLTPLDLSKGADEEDRQAEVGDEMEKCQPDDLSVVNRLLSKEQKANLHLALGRSVSSPLGETVPPNSSYTRTYSNTVHSPREHPIRRADSLENITEDNDSEKDELRKRLNSLQNEIVLFKAKNTELNQSLERSNTLLREEKRRRLADRSPASTPVREVLNYDEEFQQEISLETISELPTSKNEREDILPPRRMSGERRKNSDEFEPLNEESRSRRNTMERRSSIADDETKARRKVYGQRKASMSLEDMYDLFGVSQAASSSVEGTEQTAKTLSFEVSLHGTPIHSQKNF